MLRFPVIALISFLLLSSCSQKRAALYYFNKIVAFDKKMGKLRSSYDHKIETAISDRILKGNFGQADKLRQELADKMTAAINHFKRMGKFQGDADLIDAAVRFFSAIRDFYLEEKKEIISLRTRFIPLGPEEQKRIEDLNTQITSKSQDILSEFVAAQQVFAGKYGFPLIFPEK